MQGDGTIFAGPEAIISHHSAFVSGRPVASAGHIRAINGKITYLSPESGHYKPPRDYFEQVITELKRNNVEVPDHVVHNRDPLTSKQLEKLVKAGSDGRVIIDYAVGAQNVKTGTHIQGQQRRLYPGSKPK